MQETTTVPDAVLQQLNFSSFCFVLRRNFGHLDFVFKKKTEGAGGVVFFLRPLAPLVLPMQNTIKTQQWEEG